tara:strand:+ start:2674 stop:2877 length:204 start_codon:yes stop_codon:yes gene_type:complete
MTIIIIITFGVGFIIGMYISSQIERDIEYNIEYNNETHKTITILQYLKDNYPNVYLKVQEICLKKKE